MTPTDIIAVERIKDAAYLKADRINDLLRKGMVIGGERLWIVSEHIRRHNRISWAAQDMEAAGMEGWQDKTRKAYKVLEDAKQGKAAVIGPP